MRPSFPALILLLACTLLAGCAGTTRTLAADGVTFIVVRHAEKVDASHDPDLSAAGHARARALAQRLARTPLAAAYVTEFRRTGQTLAPSVQAQRLVTTAYAAAEPAAVFAARLRVAHPRGAVLIAGHSNTVPDIVAALCACTVAPMPDHEYDRLSLIRIDAGGPPRLTTERYGAATPASRPATAPTP
jgi:broad specificity phosphatase PhoE